MPPISYPAAATAADALAAVHATRKIVEKILVYLVTVWHDPRSSRTHLIMTPNHSSSRIHGLDTLRALAITLVFMYHYMCFASHEKTFGFLSDIGWVGVDLFFALSGYLIGNQIFAAMRSGGQFSLKHFYARRFLRTLPNYYVMLALYFLVPGFRAGADLLPAWKFLTFTQNYLLTPGTAFSHAWSLCIEEQFYMLLPAVALMIAGLRRSLRWAWLAIAAAFIAGIVMRASMWEVADEVEKGGIHFYQTIYYSSFCRFDELVAGVALALLKNYHGSAWTRLIAQGNRMLAAGLAASALTFYLFITENYSFGMTVLGFPMLALSFSLLILAALSQNSLLRTTRVPGAASLALWSYALYLVHKQVFFLLARPLREAGYAPDAWSGVLALTAISLLAGWLLFRLVETPFMALRSRYVPSNFATPSPKVSAAAAGSLR
jgi:peptidoglycan/LPS O-acetylase OafA/YrhL